MLIVGGLATRLPCATVGRVSVEPVLVRVGEVVLTLLVPVLIGLLSNAGCAGLLRGARSGYAFHSTVGGFSFCCVWVASALIPAVAAASASPAQKTTDRTNNPSDLVPLI